MAEPLSVTMLRKKRDKIRDVIVAYEAKLREAQADLAHVNATMRLFAASGDPADFPPYVDLNRVFRRGETTQLCLASLRLEGLSVPKMPSNDSAIKPVGAGQPATIRVFLSTMETGSNSNSRLDPPASVQVFHCHRPVLCLYRI